MNVAQISFGRPGVQLCDQKAAHLVASGLRSLSPPGHLSFPAFFSPEWKQARQGRYAKEARQVKPSQNVPPGDALEDKIAVDPVLLGHDGVGGDITGVLSACFREGGPILLSLFLLIIATVLHTVQKNTPHGSLVHGPRPSTLEAIPASLCITGIADGILSTGLNPRRPALIIIGPLRQLRVRGNGHGGMHPWLFGLCVVSAVWQGQRRHWTAHVSVCHRGGYLRTGVFISPHVWSVGCK